MVSNVQPLRGRTRVPGPSGTIAMNRPFIICSNCGRNWPLPVVPSLYQELVLETQPCPACEAHTLNCPDSDAEEAAWPRPLRETRQRGQPPELISLGPDTQSGPEP